MFKTTISSFTIEGQVLQAVASPSLNRIAVARPEQDATGPVVEIYDSTALVAPLDRSRLTTTAEGLSSASPGNSPGGRHRTSSVSGLNGHKTAAVVLFPAKDCHARRWYQHVTTMAWLDDDTLAVLCRNERGSSTSLTVIAVASGHSSSLENVSVVPTWATPSWSRLVDGCAWVVTLSSHLLRQYILCGKKDALIELTHADTVAPEPAELTEGGLSVEDVEQFIIDGVWQLADDGIRDAVWIQLDQVLASVKFRHVGQGMFMYHVLHRIPLNNNILTLEHGLKPLKWASAMRVVFVYDEEFCEVKVWSLQVSTAICIANISVHAAVSQIFCSDDATMLIAAAPDGLRLFNTENAFRSFTSAHAKSKRRADFLRTCIGAPLEQELSALIPWSAVDRSSKAKMRLFRDTPHAFTPRLADSRSKFERCAVVENNISILANSGEAVVFTSTGEVLHEENILQECTNDSKSSAVLLHARRPPLPNHVLHLVLSSKGVVAYFATNQINKDELLRNEIKFDFLATALLLCDLNGWNKTDIQEKTLNIAIADSPEAVFNVINETFSHERDDSTTAPRRPVATLQLLVRLCNAICSRFDNCPDDLQARQALRSLVGVTVTACSIVESHCMSLVPREAVPKLLSWIDESAPIEKPFTLHNADGDGDLDDGESATAAVRDVYLLMSLVAGLRSAQSSIPHGGIITANTNSFEWSPQRSSKASVPPRGSIVLSQQQEDKRVNSLMEDAAMFRNDWSVFCNVLLHRVHQDGVGSGCAFINSNLPLLCLDLRQKLDELCFTEPRTHYFSEVVTPVKAPNKRLQDLITENTLVANLQHLQLLVSRLVLAQLQHALNISSAEQVENQQQQKSPTSFSAPSMPKATSRDDLGSSSNLAASSSLLPIEPVASLEILVKTFSKRKALLWWATARRRTISPSMRNLLDDVLKSYVESNNKKLAKAVPGASAPLVDEEGLILLLDVVASPDLVNFQSGNSAEHSADSSESTSSTSQFARTFALRAAFSHGRFAQRKDAVNSLNAFKVPPQNDDDGEGLGESGGVGARKYVRTINVSDLDEHRGVVPVRDIGEAAAAMVLKPSPPLCYCPMAVSWIEGADTATQAQHLAPSLFETLVFQRRDVKLVDGSTAALRVLSGEASCEGTPLAFLKSASWFNASFHQSFVKGALLYCVARLDAEAAAWLALNSRADLVANSVLDTLGDVQTSQQLETPITSKMKFYVLECALASSTSASRERFTELLKQVQPLFRAQQQLPLGFSLSTPLRLLTNSLEDPVTRPLAIAALVGLSTESLVPLSKYFIISLLDATEAWAALDSGSLERLADEDLTIHQSLKRAEIKSSQQLAAATIATIAPPAAALSSVRTEATDILGAVADFISRMQNSTSIAGYEGVMVAALAGVRWSALPAQAVRGMLEALIQLDIDYSSLCLNIAAQLGPACVQEVQAAIKNAASQRVKGGSTKERGGVDDDDATAQRQRLIDMACRLNANSANARVMDLLSDANKGLRLSREGMTNAKNVTIPSRDVAEDFFSLDAKAAGRAAASLHQWVCVESIVKNAERPEDVVVDSWELLADGRPITAFHMLPSLVESRESIVQSAREIAISRANDVRHVAIYAAFLYLLDPMEFTRLLLDAAVVQRLMKFTKQGPQAKAALQSIKLIPSLPLPTSEVSPDPRSVALIANTLQVVTELLSQSASSELDDDGVPPATLVARFVMMYGSPEDARAVIGASVSEQLKKQDWVQALYVLWATQSSTCRITETGDFQSQLPLLHTLQQQQYCPDNEMLVAQRLPDIQNENVNFTRSLFLRPEESSFSIGRVILQESSAAAKPKASSAEEVLLKTLVSMLLLSASDKDDDDLLKRELKRLIVLAPPPPQLALDLTLALVSCASLGDVMTAAEMFRAAGGAIDGRKEGSALHFTAAAATCLEFHILLSQRMYHQAAQIALTGGWPSDASSAWSNVIRRTMQRLIFATTDVATTAASETSEPVVRPSSNALSLYRIPVTNLCHVLRKWIDAALQALDVTQGATARIEVREVAAHVLCNSFMLQAFVSGRSFSDSQIVQGILAEASGACATGSIVVLTKESIDDFFRVQVAGSQSVVAKAEKYFINMFSQTGGTLFACRIERSSFLESIFDYFVEEIGVAEDSAAKTLLRLSLAHIGPYDLTTDIVLLHVFLHEQHVCPVDEAVVELVSHCHHVINCCSSRELPPLVLAALLHALAGQPSSGDDAPSIPHHVHQKMIPIMQHNPSFRAWVSKRFSIDAEAAAALQASGPQAPADSVATVRIASFLKKDLAKELADAVADTSLSSEAVRVSQWKAISSILAAGESEAVELLPQYILLQTDFLAADEHRDSAVGRFVEVAAMSVMRAHVVPVLIDCAEKLYAREKVKYPHGLKDFESITGHYFFREDVLAPKGGPYNYFGLGESSGWMARPRIDAICELLRALDGVQDSPADDDDVTNASSRDRSSPAVVAFGLAIFRHLDKFQGIVSLPNKAFYSKIFLEAVALVVVIGSWVLRRNYDHKLARAIAKELQTVAGFSLADADFELVRKIVFSYPDMSLLRYVFDIIPVPLLATMGSASPVFMQQPLHLCSVRVATMSFLETLCDDEELAKKAKIELTTLYLNFRNFTALGEQLHADGNRMLETYISNTNSQKKGLLDKEKETLKRQTKMLEEVEAKFLQAAGLYVQDSLFERCLMCIRDLCVISVQKKTTTKILGLPVDQILPMLQSLEDPYDVISLAYGFQITSAEEWAIIAYRQAVVNGRKEFWSAMRALSICVLPDLTRRIANLHRGEVPSTKDAPSRNANYQWLLGELQKGSQ